MLTGGCGSCPRTRRSAARTAAANAAAHLNCLMRLMKPSQPENPAGWTDRSRRLRPGLVLNRRTERGGRQPLLLRSRRNCPFPSCRMNSGIASEGFAICQDDPGSGVISGFSGGIGLHPYQLSQGVKGCHTSRSSALRAPLPAGRRHQNRITNTSSPRWRGRKSPGPRFANAWLSTHADSDFVCQSSQAQSSPVRRRRKPFG